MAIRPTARFGATALALLLSVGAGRAVAMPAAPAAAAEMAGAPAMVESDTPSPVASVPSVDPLAVALRAAIEVHTGPLAGSAPVDKGERDEAAAARAASKDSKVDTTWAAIGQFYVERDFEPVWYAGGVATPAAKAVAARLAHAGEDGLDPAAYRQGATGFGTRGPETPARVAAAELAMAQAVLAFAHDAQTGRVVPSSLSTLTADKPTAPDPSSVLRVVSSAADADAALESYNPPQEGFRRLKAKLAEIRAGRKAVAKPVADGDVLKPGMHDPRIVAIRERLALPSDADADLYDDDLVEAVKTFQADHRLKPNGIIGASTVRAMNRGLGDEAVTGILINMERWRWMPRDLGAAHVWVDIPGYSVAVVRDGNTVLTTRVVVGRATNQTPTLSSRIVNIVVNPYWNVPVSIVRKEMLASIRNNPSYLTRRNYEVLVNGKRVDPHSIVWSEKTARQVSIRQKPGQGNALGNIKFLFPNDFSVYLHDTSAKALFSNELRADSHGCVRVQNPIAFADALLADEPHWNGSRLEKLVGGSERWVRLTKPVDVHLTYFTTVVDADGNLDMRADIYGRDDALKAALGL